MSMSETEQSDDLRGLSILLVEDSPVVADALKQHLELFGATVAGPAAATAEAREAIMAGRPDVALVDFHFRGENSYTLIAELREAVIMLSGSIEARRPNLTLDEIVVAMHKRRIAGSRSAVWRFFQRHRCQ
jgi:CheY-like chemotaxis protein